MIILNEKGVPQSVQHTHSQNQDNLRNSMCPEIRSPYESEHHLLFISGVQRESYIAAQIRFVLWASATLA